MIPRQKELHEINEMSREYQTHLKLNGVSAPDAKKCAIGLSALYWQAGEQMGSLMKLIENDPKDGFLFRMMIGTAYTILDSLEAIAELAQMGDETNEGYRIPSKTHFIKTLKIHKNDTECEDLSDWDYFKFLRSFICAHPLETTNPRTKRGYIPGDYAYCKVVDYIVDNLLFLKKPDGADYYVQALDDGTHWLDVDFYINSNEIWQYVISRFNKLVDVIHSTMIVRIRDTKEKLIHTEMPKMPPEPDFTALDVLIKEDWNRGGIFHDELMICKLLLYQISKKITWDANRTGILNKLIWQSVLSISEHLQKMEFDTTTVFGDCVYDMMKKVGCDHNQRSNFSDLLFDSYSFGVDCESFVENGVDNYEETPCFNSLTEAEREQLYNEAVAHLQTNPNCPPIDLVTYYYCTTDLPRREIARLYFITVLPSFVEKYGLLDAVYKMDDCSLYLNLLSCMALECSSNNSSSHPVVKSNE